MDPTRKHPLIARYRLRGANHYGELSGGFLLRWDGAPWLGGRPTGERDPVAAIDGWLPPAEPTKIVCVGLNYIEHVRESLTAAPNATVPEEPLLFLKPPSAALAHGSTIRYPAGVTRLDPEGEMALVIGRRACAVPLERALDHVAGVTAFNDVSARNFQKSDGQWARAKGFDTFAPFGPVVALGLSPLDLALELRVNGETRQKARTSGMHFGPAFLVHHISKIMTLEPGDVIATGTPAGIAPLTSGDVIEVEIEGVGVLRNPLGPVEA